MVSSEDDYIRAGLGIDLPSVTTTTTTDTSASSNGSSSNGVGKCAKLN
jgi:hypothetical protein